MIGKRTFLVLHGNLPMSPVGEGQGSAAVVRHKWMLAPFFRAVSFAFIVLFCAQVSAFGAENTTDAGVAECRKSLTDKNFIRARSILTVSKIFLNEYARAGGGGKIVIIRENVSTIFQGGECFIEIPVYSDGNYALHLFASFAVSLSGKVLVMDVDGDYVE